ncbi:MAG: AMP-binding protein, partial [Cyclobacteriaceae bacterium]|nr:AMP-binding protein [Cyclobacteriaceae bacterium]
MHTYPWFSNYPAGVPSEIDADQYQNLTELLDNAFTAFSEKVAFTNMDKAYTFQEVEELSRNFASYLQHVAQLKPGDRIAIQMPNLHQYP